MGWQVLEFADQGADAGYAPITEAKGQDGRNGGVYGQGVPVRQRWYASFYFNTLSYRALGYHCPPCDNAGTPPFSIALSTTLTVITGYFRITGGFFHAKYWKCC